MVCRVRYNKNSEKWEIKNKNSIFYVNKNGEHYKVFVFSDLLSMLDNYENAIVSTARLGVNEIKTTVRFKDKLYSGCLTEVD